MNAVLEDLEVVELEKIFDADVTCEYGNCDKPAAWRFTSPCCAPANCERHFQLSVLVIQRCIAMSKIVFCNTHNKDFLPHLVRWFPL